MYRPHVLVLLVAIHLPVVIAGEVRGAETGFTPLFNGKDLSGPVNVNGAPSTFTVRDSLIISTGIPTGVMRTENQYESFILELEWRHMKAGCPGIEPAPSNIVFVA